MTLCSSNYLYYVIAGKFVVGVPQLKALDLIFASTMMTNLKIQSRSE